jgi:hypothetical protein
MDTIRIEMDMPMPPEGWRYKAYQPPLKGEYYRTWNGRAAKAETDHPADMLAPILERVPWVPKPGETYWFYQITQNRVEPRINRMHDWDEDALATGNYFRMQFQAEKFATESRALADRIRAESEG